MRDNCSCFVDSGFSGRLLLVEFKGTAFLYTSLHNYENVSPIESSRANLTAKYVLPGPLPFSRMLLKFYVNGQKLPRPSCSKGG